MFDIKTLSQQAIVGITSNLFNILLLLFTIAIIAIILLFVPKKSEDAKKITKIIMGSVLAFVYLARVVFWIIRVYAQGSAINAYLVYKIFGLDLSMWLLIISCVVMFYGAFSKKQSQIITIFSYAMLAIALPLSIIKFVNPILGITYFQIIDTTDRWYHISNLSNIIVNICQILFPLYLISIKEIKPKLDNYWKGLAVFIMIMSVVATVALPITKLSDVQIPKSLTNELFGPFVIAMLGMQIDFPWHLLINFGGFLTITILVYLLVGFICSKIQKEENNPLEETKKDEFLELYAFATKSILCMQGILLIIVLDIVFSAEISVLWSIFMIVPLFMTIFCLLAVKKMKELSKEYNEEFYNPDNKGYKTILKYLLLGDVFFALAFRKQYYNEITAIEDRKKRAEKKRLKELKMQQEAEQQPQE